MNDREQAWDAIHGRLPAGWRTAPPTLDPATRRWSVTALGPKLGGRRGKPPATVMGERPDELAALRDLAERLARRSAGPAGDRGLFASWRSHPCPPRCARCGRL